MREPFANIGDHVYHITPDSPRGVVVDVSYSYYTRTHIYLVTFSVEIEARWYTECELSKTKQY